MDKELSQTLNNVSIQVSNPPHAESSLTVQDIIMSNPLRSAGVRELEIVTLYAVVYGGSETYILCNYMHLLIHHSMGFLKYNIHVYTITNLVLMDNTYPMI